MDVNEYQQIYIDLYLIKSTLEKYINGTLKNINLHKIESNIYMYTIQLNNLLSKQNEELIKNESDTFIC